jgi:hypothetical protein
LAPAGYKVLYEELTACVAEHYPELVPEKLPLTLPIWDSFPEDGVVEPNRGEA